MHATVEQLLDLRDRKPVAANTLQHLEVCAACRRQLDQLKALRNSLCNLPSQAPGQDLWPLIQARLEAEHAEKSSPFHRSRTGIAMAASVLLMVSLGLLMIFHFTQETVSSSPPPAVAGTERPAFDAVSVPAADPDPLADTDARLAELMDHSVLLEAALRALPERPGVLRASTAETIMGLEDGVALIDYQLNQEARQLNAAQSRLLWQWRVDLLNSLVNVRYAEVQPVAYTRF